MEIKRIEGFTRVLGEAQGYLGLPLRDIVIHDAALGGAPAPAMLTEWKPSASDLLTLIDGGSIFLEILGSGHPPVIILTASGADEAMAELGAVDR